MKKWAYFLGTALFFALLLSVLKSHSEGKYLNPVGYIPYFKKHKGKFYRQFKQKIRTPLPAWVQRQIAQDLTVEKISLEALEATQQAIFQTGNAFPNRYRIVGNKLYQYLNPSQELRTWEPSDCFVNALKTLIELTSLPNVDFIATPEDGTFEPYYLVPDPHLQAPILGWAKVKSLPFFVLIPDWRSLASWWHDDVRKLKEGKNYKGERVSWDQKQPIAFWRGGLTERVYRPKMGLLSEQFPSLINAGLVPHQKPSASYEEHLYHKYLPVLDGIMCSYPGYQWRLLSDALVLKQESDQIQWFYEALSPYVHYVPFKKDLSDLVEQILWAQGHDEVCRQIALQATQFIDENLMFDDIYCYLYHVLLAYSQLQDESLEKDWASTDHWVKL